jgi:hypothetical protein
MSNKQGTKFNTKAIIHQPIHTTHPGVTTNELPPENTIIIEAHITSLDSKKSKQKIDGHLRNRIITTCSDADAMVGTKHIDPALCIYISAHLICIDNKHLKSKTPRGNGRLCRVIGVKLKENATKYKWKNYHGKKCGQSMQKMLNEYNLNLSTSLDTLYSWNHK